MEDNRVAQIAALAAVEAVKAMGYKAPTGTGPAAQGWTHGVGGTLGVPGVEPDVISARVVPRGIASMIPMHPSVYAFPEFAYVTGIEDLSHDEPANECSTCIAAVMEGCTQSACFGRVCRESRELTVNRAIMRINRGDIDLRLMNDMLGAGPFLPYQNYDRNRVLQLATMQAMVEIAASMQQALVPMVWIGNPANNVGTGYMEFNGLDTLISRGKVDYHTSIACQALDSDVKDFNYQNITTVVGNAFAIVRMLSAMEQYVYHNADRMGLLPATWAWAMRPETWQELTEIWPVAYLTTRTLVLPAGNTNNIDAIRVNELRDMMRRGRTLEVNGRSHPVVLDDGIAEETNADNAAIPAGSFASNIYLVPLTFLGGQEATYLQYVDFRAGQNEITLSNNQDTYWATNEGRYLWTVERVKFCYTLSAEIKPRVVLRVPQLAGRLDNVVYSPEQHFRSPFDTDYYFYKGGVDHRTFPYGRVYPEQSRQVGVVPTENFCQD